MWSPPDDVPSFYRQFATTLTSQKAEEHQHYYEVTECRNATGSKKAVSSELCQASTSICRELDCNRGRNNVHTYLGDIAVYDRDSFVSKKSFAYQTDNEPSIHKHGISTKSNYKNITDAENTKRFTIACQTDNSMSPYQHCLTGKSSDPPVINESTPNSILLRSCEKLQSEHLILGHYPCTKSYEKVAEPSFNATASTSSSLHSHASCQTEGNASEFNSSVPTLGTKEKNIEGRGRHASEVEKTTSNNSESGDQLDFNVLNEINFKQLHSLLNELPTKLSVLDISNTTQDEPVLSNDNDLMLKLSDLSKDQLSACSRVPDDQGNIIAESLYQKKRKIKGNRIATKAIHTWSELSSDDNPTQEPRTIFLDLRSKLDLKSEKVVYNGRI